MAKENVKKFYEEFAANKELQEKFIEVQKGYEAEEKSEEEILEDIVLPIAKEAGYEFTMSEYRSVQRDAMAENGISEEELENVSGGGACYFIGLAESIGVCMGLGTYKNVVDKSSNKTISGGAGINICYVIGVGIGGYF